MWMPRPSIAAAVMILSAPCGAASPIVPIRDNPGSEIACLATAIGYEAGNEPIAGQEAVAEVILNRAADPRFPKAVCDVVYQGSGRASGCQFSFTCDGSMRRTLPPAMLVRTQAIAKAALEGRTPRKLSGATHYHADYVMPYWAGHLARVAVIGRHIFYRTTSRQGRSAPLPFQPVNAMLPPDGRSMISRTERFSPWGLSLPDLPSRASDQ